MNDAPVSPADDDNVSDAPVSPADDDNVSDAPAVPADDNSVDNAPAVPVDDDNVSDDNLSNNSVIDTAEDDAGLLPGCMINLSSLLLFVPLIIKLIRKNKGR